MAEERKVQDINTAHIKPENHDQEKEQDHDQEKEQDHGAQHR